IKAKKLFECVTRKPNPFQTVPHIAKFWDEIDNIGEGFWKAPNGLYWICGKKAYATLPRLWSGTCTLGVIRPSFFLLPLDSEQNLGVSL
ncbi:ENR1 protein, partial [Pomatostomus ruficeps]|nr:ENR1 protein [Pomatostomus ruficeps]